MRKLILQLTVEKILYQKPHTQNSLKILFMKLLSSIV